MNLFEALASVYTQGAYPVPVDRPAFAPAAPRTSAFAWLAKAWDRWRKARRHANAERALLRLDDRLLADIGVNRGDVPYLIAYGRMERPLNDNRSGLASCG